MARLTSIVCLGMCIAASAVGSGARAQATPATAAPPAAVDRTEEAKALFAAGRSAFEAGRYQDALVHFERCYAISQRAALLYNIALAHDRLRDDDKALASYDAYLAAVPGAENRVEVETRSAALRAALERRQQAAAAAPTPAETAAASTAASSEPAPSMAPDEPVRDDDGGLLGKWWFWTAVGVVVVGGVTVGIVVASSGDDEASPLAPKSGVVVTTLGRAP